MLLTVSVGPTNKNNLEFFGRLSYSHLATHATWLVQSPFHRKDLMHNITHDRLPKVSIYLAYLLQQVKLKEAEEMYQQAL